MMGEGEFVKIKIENMSEQHTELANSGKAPENKKQEQKNKINKIKKKKKKKRKKKKKKKKKNRKKEIQSGTKQKIC